MFASRDATMAAAAMGGKAAVLFVDTFNGTFETENARAAARVLQAAGYTLHTVGKAERPSCAAAAPTSPAGMVERSQGQGSPR